MVCLGLVARTGALTAVVLGVAAVLGLAACSDGTTPDCADAACGYPISNEGPLADGGAG